MVKQLHTNLDLLIVFKAEECKSCIEKMKINSECCFVGLKNNRLIYKCKECRKERKKPIDELK